MKRMSLALACAFGTAIFAGTSHAQTLRQPLSVKPIAFNYDYYADDTAASPSDQVAAEAPAASEAAKSEPAVEPAPAATADYSAVGSGCSTCSSGEACSTCNSCSTCDPCGSACGSCDLGLGLLGDCEVCEPWALMDIFGCQKDCLAENGWTIGGHTQFGYQDGPDGSFTGNGPFLNQREWNNVNLNQQYLYIGKAADGSNGLGLGFRMDVMYGVDGNEGQSFGNVNPGQFDFLNGWDHGIYEWAMPQLYGEVAIGEDLLVKVGHFYTLIGYEVVPSSGQFFYSRQLTFWNSEPFTHTGVLASYTASDKLTINGGWVLGMDTGFDQFNQGNAFLGGFTYQISDDTAFIYAMTGGNLGWRGNGAINSVILTQQWTDKVSSAHQFDVLSSDLGSDFRNPNSFTAGDSTGFINYLFYDINPCLKSGSRFEWYKADGVSYYTMTGGVNIKATSNLTVRPEVRRMWSPGNEDIYTGSGFNDQLFNQTVFGIDAILTY